jgi:hypothetical protein
MLLQMRMLIDQMAAERDSPLVSRDVSNISSFSEKLEMLDTSATQRLGGTEFEVRVDGKGCRCVCIEEYVFSMHLGCDGLAHQPLV